MRLLIVVPNQPEATGNFVTARRLQSGLQTLGITVELFILKDDHVAAFTSAVDQFLPDRLLLLHAWRTGRWWLESPAINTRPATILLTGTDINLDIDDATKGPAIEKVLQNATAIVSQNRQTVESLRKQNPSWIERLHHIPPGVSLGKTHYPLRKNHSIAAECRLFLHPAGIRPVKANLELLKLCDPLAENNMNFALAFCGPALDPDYFERFITAINQRPWAHYLGVIPSDAMPSAMAEADAILNNSSSEGVSNALLEALALGRPVLARNIPGNASIQSSEGSILLYNSADEFINLAQQVVSTPPSFRQSNASIYNRFSAKIEAEKFAALFKHH